MDISFAQLSAGACYHLMTQVIVPRPIAWVLTQNPGEEPRYHLAPFSYFNAICSDPPLVLLSLGHKPDGDAKDTAVNIRQHGQMVIHIANVAAAAKVSASAATLAHGESEVERLGLGLCHDSGWSLPRLADCDVAMACHLYQSQQIGPQQQALFFCQIDQLYINEAVTTPDVKDRLKVDTTALEPLARLGANEYASFGKVFSLARPR